MNVIVLVIVDVDVDVDGWEREGDSHDKEPAEEAPVRAGRLLGREVRAGVFGAPFQPEGARFGVFLEVLDFVAAEAQAGVTVLALVIAALISFADVLLLLLFLVVVLLVVVFLVVVFLITVLLVALLVTGFAALLVALQPCALLVADKFNNRALVQPVFLVVERQPTSMQDCSQPLLPRIRVRLGGP